MSVADTQEPGARQGDSLTGLGAVLLSQRGSMVLWVPVCLGTGIGWYFSLATEPDAPFWISICLSGVGFVVLSRLVPLSVAPLCMAMALVIAGMGLAKAHTEWRSAPLLGFRYYGPIEGQVVGIDRSASDAVRLTLAGVRLDRLSPGRTPLHVRVSLHGDQPLAAILPGDHVMLTGHLSPPAGPAEPGGFDFQRHAYFLGIGAVGYTRTPVLRSAPASVDGLGHWVFVQRMTISTAVQRILPGETGAFAAAILTGDRSAMGQGTLQALRDSNLAHLLAISGLHMGLLTGVVFTAVRAVGAAIPPVALRWPLKKIAAVAAVAAGAAYLALSGGNVATERAFIMASVFFGAVMLDRRALTLRAVAIAATIVLVLRPDALTGPGFQMSFAATTALVAVFRVVRTVDLGFLPKWARPVLFLIISSLVAGLATAPFAAAHFNRIAHYGLIANLSSVPLMGILVMPAAVLAACLAPFGLAWVGLALMALGLDWILWVAQTVAAQEGSVGMVVSPGSVVLPLLTLGALWGVLWRGTGRVLGLPVVVAAFVVWIMTERPAVLVADSGGLIGWNGPAGRVLSRATGNGFVARVWLENDGDPTSQEDAAARPGFEDSGSLVSLDVEGWHILQVRGSRALEELVGCGGADVLIVTTPDEKQRTCEVFDVSRLRDSGSLAFMIASNGELLIVTAASRSGLRPWTGKRDPQAGAEIVLRRTLDQ